MGSLAPFDSATVGDLIRVRSDGGMLHVLTHESVTKEFKESFTYGSLGLYARTMAAFANAHGGYIFFGVTDSPRTAVGLSDAARTMFDNLDRAKITEGLNDLFSPELEWETALFDVGGVTLGSIYTFECRNKPIVARKNYDKENARLGEGDIIYRYNSRTERIKYSELRTILDAAKATERDALMALVQELIRAGASNAAVLDFGTSTLQGPMGQKVLIDEDLLDKIEFIREGEFDEVAGAPTLKVVGDVVAAKTLALAPARVVKTVLTTEDVLTDFLDHDITITPIDYIRQAATGTTSFVPIHYYRVAAGLTHEELGAFVDSVHTRAQAKPKLVERIARIDSMQHTPPTTSTQHASTVQRRAFWEKLTAGTLPSLEFNDVDQVAYFLQAVQCLDDNQVRALGDSLFSVVRTCFDLYETDSRGKVADALRRATCRIDAALYLGENP